MATLGHFEIVAAENGEKPKSGTAITQPLLLTVLPYLPQNNCFWGWEKLRIGENILLCNDSFSKSKMAPNYGQWKVSILYLCKRRVPLIVATKHVCITLIPFWNNYYWFKHAKTNISKVYCIYWSLSLHHSDEQGDYVIFDILKEESVSPTLVNWLSWNSWK